MFPSEGVQFKEQPRLCPKNLWVTLPWLHTPHIPPLSPSDPVNTETQAEGYGVCPKRHSGDQTARRFELEMKFKSQDDNCAV